MTLKIDYKFERGLDNSWVSIRSNLHQILDQLCTYSPCNCPNDQNDIQIQLTQFDTVYRRSYKWTRAIPTQDAWSWSGAAAHNVFLVPHEESLSVGQVPAIPLLVFL